MIENVLLFALIEGRGAPMSMNHPEQSITRSVSNTPFNSMGDIGDFSEIIKISYNTTIYGSEGVFFSTARVHDSPQTVKTGFFQTLLTNAFVGFAGHFFTPK